MIPNSNMYYISVSFNVHCSSISDGATLSNRYRGLKLVKPVRPHRLHDFARD